MNKTRQETVVYNSSNKKQIIMKTKLIQILSLVFMLGVVVQMPLLHAQQTQTYANNLVLNEFQQEQSQEVQNLLEKSFEFDLQELSLEDAIVKIAEKADLKLMYSRDILPEQSRVSLQSSLSLYDAMWRTLAGTGLQFAISKNGQLVIYPMDEVTNLDEYLRGTLSGRVIDAGSGESLPGANVYIEEAQQGTSTDINGEFSIPNIDDGIYTVTVSYVGFIEITEEIEIDGETTIEFELEESAAELDEVVVTGYGVRRTKPTGAISTVRGQDFQQRSIQTADQALQGRAAGFRMVGTSGAPGGETQIRIRGIGSINASTDPLFIIDGARIESSYRGTMGSNNILQGINPNDIESMTVLKDAEATALYGAEGANGVVLITTRRGEEGPTQFSANSQWGVSVQPFEYDLMNGPDFVRTMMEAYANRYEDLGTTSYGGDVYADPREAGEAAAINAFGDPNEVGTYDWYGTMIQPGVQQRYSLSARGGTESTQFYVSGGLNDQEGTFLENKFERISLRSNVTHRASERLSFDLNTNISRSLTTGIGDHNGAASGGSNWIGSPFHGGVTTRVTTPIYNEDGTYNQDTAGLSGVLYNNVQVLKEEERTSRTFQLIGNASATYNFTNNLSFRSRWSTDFRTVLDRRFYNPSIDRYAAYGGGVYERTRDVTSWNTDQVLDFTNTFGGIHNVNALLGVEYQHMYQRQMLAHGRNLPSSLFQTINSAAENFSVGSTFGEYKNAGTFSRVEYDYDNRYYAAVNLRYDGSSRFGENRRYGLFYSGSLAWDVASESFMDPYDFITELRPRISYGTSGNSGIGYYAARPFFGTGGSYGGQTGLRPTQLGNANLTWEVAKSTDIGVDWSVFEGRGFGTFAFFRKDNENLLLDRNLPSNSGFGSITDNVGEVRVQGFEAEFGAVILQSNKFAWTSEFNITFEESEILSLSDGAETIGNTIRVGQPRLIRWGPESAGVNPANGQPMWYDENGDLTYSVTSADSKVIGSELPDFYGGWSNRFDYGPFTASVMFHYEFGKDLWNYQHDVFMMAPSRGRTISTNVFDAWQQPGDMTEVPRVYNQLSFPGGSSITTFGSNNLQDGSFIRLKHLELRYNVPQRVLENVGLNSLSIFVQGENMLTWTAFEGPDPEVIAQTQTYYPQPKTFMGGINIDF